MKPKPFTILSAADLSRLLRSLLRNPGADQIEQLHRYQALIDDQWKQTDLLQADLVERGHLALASAIPSRAEVAAQFQQIAHLAAAGKNREIDPIAKSLANAFRKATEALRAVNDGKSSSAATDTHALLADCGRGMLQSTLGQQDFRLAIANRLSAARKNRPQLHTPKLPLFSETNIIKPGARQSVEVEALTPEETGFIAKYGKVDDLPMTIFAPLALGNALAVDLPAEAFLAGKPLDSDSLPEDAPIDYATLLRNYASKHGSMRYFYVASASMFRRTQDSYATDQPPTAAQLRESLRDSMTAHLLFNPPSAVSKLGGNVVADVFEFRKHVLNWGTLSASGAWTPRSPAPSFYAPETLSQEISRLPFLREGAQQFWSQEIATARSRAIGYMNSELASAIGQTQGNSEPDDRLIIALAAKALRYLYFAGSSSKSKESLQLPVFGLPPSNLDIHFVRNFLAAPTTFYVANKTVIKQQLVDLTDLFTAASELFEDWEIAKPWKLHSDYLLFVETVKVQAEAVVALDASAEVALSRALEAIRMRHRQHINAYLAVEKEVTNGLFYQEWASITASLLSAACQKKRILTDSFQPLVLRSASAVSALGSSKYLERIPVSRETNFFVQRPSVGVMKEYRLELQHAGFGLGKHLYSQTLFPGETVSIEIASRVRQKETETQSSAEHIFEEASTETLDEFTADLRLQLQNENRESHTSETEVGASASGDLFGIINIDAKASGKWSSMDEERAFSDRVNNLLQKLSTKLSQKRQVQLDLKIDKTVERESEESTKTTRSYSNLNKEKNLTVNFFQVTRKHRSAIYLDDLRFYYSSGRFPIMKIFVPHAITTQEAERILGAHPLLADLAAETGVDYRSLLAFGLVAPLPSELWDEFPNDAVIVILATPFTVSIPFSNVNAFLVGNLSFTKAREINEQLWTMIGGGQASPEGLAVCAFPFGKVEAPDLWPHEGKTQDDWTHTAPIRGALVCADRIEMEGTALAHPLPNLDLRRKQTAALNSRYVSPAEGALALPKLLATHDYVVNTNGVYAENMLGQCGALEEYATRHRELDVRQKELEIERTAFGLEREKEQLSQTRKAQAPARDDYPDRAEYDQAILDFQRLRAIDTVKEHRITAPPGVTVNLSLDAGQNGSASVSTQP
ncbi:MAG: hypothetical protein OEL83_15130 [Desulforhopalus sp.]|nr:hypothetical protein [Desulforhopalus sp.]